MNIFSRKLIKIHLVLVTVLFVAACGSVSPTDEVVTPDESLQVDVEAIQSHFVFTEDELLGLDEDAEQSLTPFDYEMALIVIEVSNLLVSDGHMRYGDTPDGHLYDVDAQANDLEAQWCTNYNRFIYWQHRGGSHPWSLTIIPTRRCRFFAGNYYLDAWNEMVRKAPRSARWNRGDRQVNRSMFHQYVCHAYFGSIPGGLWQGEWDLEPTRPAVSWRSTVLQGCNPS